ncbi:hypothetical protein BH23BAC1_BH23BAC1_10180 [soil metagenome]
MNYKVIKTDKQYKEYCDKIMELESGKITSKVEEELELLDLLIDTYSKNRFKRSKQDPIQLLKNLMENQEINQIQLAKILGVNKSYVSLILNYKKGLSKDIIRKLADIFKVSQEAFNRSYELVSTDNHSLKNETMSNEQ